MTKELKIKIFNFIGINRRTESIHVATYFNLKIDIVLTALKEMQDEGKIKRHWTGCEYLYEVKND